MTAKALAVKLMDLGIPVAEVYGRASATDAGVDIDKSISVQIAYGRLIVNESYGEGDDWCIAQRGTFATAEQAAKRIRELMALRN